jgi:anti-anti-sigma factor
VAAAYRDRVGIHGLVGGVSGVGSADHLCWIHDDAAGFDRAVQTFLAGGLERGERLLCVGDRVAESLRANPLPFGGVDALMARGGLESVPLTDGYRGLRVIAENSALAGDPAHRPGLVRWEHLADEFVVNGHGFSAMCADRADLTPEALTDVASVHPLVHAPEGVPSFRVFSDEGCLALAGSVDTFGASRLAALLTSVAVPGPVVTLDLTSLEFLDAAGCRVLARWAQDLRARTIALELRAASGPVQRMWQILGFSGLAPVTFVEAGA